MKYIRGFLMAWGCFSWIPCPYKKWNEEDRPAMLAMLPLVGTGLGLCTALIWWICGVLTGASGVAPLLCGVLVTAVYFLLTGFIHLDGFMDVADAVMPRHPRLEERRRILKDPHTGSFGVVSLVLMLLVFAGSVTILSQPPVLRGMLGVAGSEMASGGSAASGSETPAGMWFPGMLAFIAVVTTSRCISAVSVLCCRPMATSQYAANRKASSGSETKATKKALHGTETDADRTGLCSFGTDVDRTELRSFGTDADRTELRSLGTDADRTELPSSAPDTSETGRHLLGGWRAAMPAVLLTIVVVGLCTGFSSQVTAWSGSAGDPGGTAGTLSLTGLPGSGAYFWIPIACLVCGAVALVMGALDRRSLGGMSGDISGHMITSGEMAGLLAAALLL